MKLSVLVLSYNFENYIEQCLLSILSQKTNFEFEILVRDDFSSDKSASIINRIKIYYPTIKFIKGEENIGFAKSYKQILDLAKGEYIAYTDGDDYWFDMDKLQKQVDFLDSNPDYTLTCTGYWEKNKAQDYFPPSPHHWLSPLRHDGKFNIPTEEFLQGNYAHYGKVYRNVPHFFDYMYELPMLDWPMNFELSLRGKVKFLQFPSGIYRKHEGGLMAQLKKVQNVREQILTALNKRYNEFNS